MRAYSASIIVAKRTRDGSADRREHEEALLAHEGQPAARHRAHADTELFALEHSAALRRTPIRERPRR